MNNNQQLRQAALRRQRTERFLSTLRHNQPISRIELANLTGMSPASVTRFVNVLTALRLVREVSVIGSSGRGRRAVSLHTHADGAYALGFHIAPNSLRCCLMDFDGVVRAAREVPLAPEDRDPSRLSALAGALAEQTLPADSSRVLAAGISVSGQIDMRTGLVLHSKAFGWTNADLAGPFAAALGLPVRIENDVKSCLTWEGVRRGYLENRQDIAYLYIGRAGVGFANSVEGRLVRGARNAAGEIEDVVLSMEERLGDRLMEDSLVTRARRCSPSVSGIGDILAAHRMGIPWARMLMDDFANQLNLLLQLVFALLDPHEIILGGDMADALRDRPELILDSRCAFGENFEDACARGAAFIAMCEAALDQADALFEAE